MYYKQIIGNFVNVLTCNQGLVTSDTLIEITEEEYNATREDIIAKAPKPEEFPPAEDELADAIAALELLGVTPEEGEING